MSEEKESTGQAQQPKVELGPIEKLEESEQPPGARTPGVQNPESEVQSETNPNTE